MTDNPGNAGGGSEPDGKFTDEEFKDGSHTPDRAEAHGEEGEYTDSEIPETDKDHPDQHD
jgi:hypothetical protein